MASFLLLDLDSPSPKPALWISFKPGGTPRARGLGARPLPGRRPAKRPRISLSTEPDGSGCSASSRAGRF